MVALTQSIIELIGNQKAQHDFLEDWDHGEVLYQGGFGSGKSWAAARKFLMLHVHNNCDGLVVAPTYGDLWRLAVAELESALIEWGWKYEIYPHGKGKEKFAHMIVNKRKIYLMGCEKPSTITGFEVGHIWVEEGARIKQNLINPKLDAPTQIRSRLRDRTAKIRQILISTTPEGTETWIQRDFFDKRKSMCRGYIGTTHGNKHLPIDYVQTLEEAYGSNLAGQYLGGVAADFTVGIAHPTFGDANISELADFRNTTLHIGMDFNVAPMGWVALQQVGKNIHAVDEVFIEDFALVDDAMHVAKEKKWGDYKIDFHPDKASKSRSTTGDSEFLAITNLAREWNWNFTGDAHGSNPAVNNRISNLSRLICNGVGDRRFIVHPRCVRLIDDLKKTTRKSDGGYDPGSDKKRGHILDGCGYATWDMERPMGRAGVGKIAR